MKYLSKSRITSCLSAFVITKTLKWPKATWKTAKHKSAIFRIFFSFFIMTTLFKQRYISTHRHFSTKLMLITARSSTTTQLLHSFKFSLVNKGHSQHSVVAFHWEGRLFLILYACIHIVSFPGQIPRSLVWEQDYSAQAKLTTHTAFTVSSHSSGQSLRTPHR